MTQNVISAEAREDLRGLMAAWALRHGKASSLAEVEVLAEEAQQIVGQCVMETALLGISGRATYEGALRACECGGKARFVNYRARWVKAACGEARVARAYYHCSQCRRGATPWDESQGLNERVWSPRLKATICQIAGRLSYAETVSLLAELRITNLQESSAEDVVREVGERLRSEEARKVERAQAASERATLLRLVCEPKEEAPEAVAVRPVEGKRLYATLDAATAHIGGGWRNVQVGAVYTVRSDEKGRDVLNKRSCLAERTDMERFGWKLRARADEWNMAGYEEVVVLADGAACNWNLAAVHFPAATQVLDFYHASQHVWALSRVLYRQDDAKDKARGDRWVQERLDSLMSEGPASLIRALRRRRPRTAEQREAVRRERGYFTNNQHRMNYPACLAAGMMIGSGPVEAACKVVVGQRMKQAGMRWSDVGADAILAVRTALLNQDRPLLQKMARAA